MQDKVQQNGTLCRITSHKMILFAGQGPTKWYSIDAGQHPTKLMMILMQDTIPQMIQSVSTYMYMYTFALQFWSLFVKIFIMYLSRLLQR